MVTQNTVNENTSLKFIVLAKPNETDPRPALLRGLGVYFRPRADIVSSTFRELVFAYSNPNDLAP